MCGPSYPADQNMAAARRTTSCLESTGHFSSASPRSFAIVLNALQGMALIMTPTYARSCSMSSLTSSHNSCRCGTAGERLSSQLGRCQESRFIVWLDREYSYRQKTKENWVTILRLATRWSFPNIKELAVQKLEALDLRPAERISIYTEHGVDDERLISPYVELCKSPTIPTLADSQLIQMETLLNILQAREEVQCEAIKLGLGSPRNASLGDETLRETVSRYIKKGLDNKNREETRQEKGRGEKESQERASQTKEREEKEKGEKMKQEREREEKEHKERASQVKEGGEKEKAGEMKQEMEMEKKESQEKAGQALEREEEEEVEKAHQERERGEKENQEKESQAKEREEKEKVEKAQREKEREEKDNQGIANQAKERKEEEKVEKAQQEKERKTTRRKQAKPR